MYAVELAHERIRYFYVTRHGMDYASQELTLIGERGPNYEGVQQLFDVTFNSATKGFLPIPNLKIDLSGGSAETERRILGLDFITFNKC